MINTLRQFLQDNIGTIVLKSTFSQTHFYFWFAVALFFLILEMGHPGLFYFLSFFFGGLAAAASTYITESTAVQYMIFFSGTIIALCFLRPWALWLSGKNRSIQQTNFYALKGRKAIVKQDIIGDNSGLVTIGGQVWVARVLHSNERLFIGDMAEVIDVRGAHVVVKKI